MANRMTKREVIAMMMQEEVIKASPLYMEFLLKYDEQLATKRVSPKEAEKAKADSALSEVICEVLGKMEKATVSELMMADERLSPMIYSWQKVTSLLAKLIKAGRVEKRPEGKKSYFVLVQQCIGRQPRPPKRIKVDREVN